MKFFLLSDNVDTQMGMRLAGIEGIVIHERDEVLRELEKAMHEDDSLRAVSVVGDGGDVILCVGNGRGILRWRRR